MRRWNMSVRTRAVWMTVALIGTTVIQVLWMRRAYEDRRHSFDFQVNRALADVVDQLQTREAALFITSNWPNDSDTVIRNSHVVMSTSPGKWVTTDERTIEHAVGAGEDSEQMDVRVELDTDMVPGHLTIRHSVMAHGDSATVIEERISSGVGEDETIERVVKKLAREYAHRDDPVAGRLNNQNVSELLVKCLQNRGVALPFEFAVEVPGPKGTERPVHSAAFPDSGAKGLHEIPLFKDDVIEKPGSLLVIFPGEDKFHLGSVMGMAALSALFTLILTFTYISTLRDWIRQKKLGEMKADFINAMTHELKTPIATIGLATDALGHPRVLDDPEKVKQYAEMIRKENQRMNRQVENVLQSSLAERTDVILQQDPVNLNQILEKAIHQIKFQAENAGGTLAIKAPLSDVIVKGDADMLEHVFLNLLDNGIKYGGDHPKVEVVLRCVDKYAEVCIRDHGKGIPVVEQEKIFGKFYRIGKGDAQSVKGFGIGLNFVRNMVERHGGKVWVESEEGNGSSFFIQLPCQA